MKINDNGKKVKNLTEKNYKIYKNIINPLNLKRVTNGNDGYQLDHKYSIFEGFINDIDINIISCHHNLNMLEWKENRNKSYNSSIEIKELINKINNDKS